MRTIINTLVAVTVIFGLTVLVGQSVDHSPMEKTKNLFSLGSPLPSVGSNLAAGLTFYGDKAVGFSGGVNGEWMRVQRASANNYEHRQFDPSFTNIVVKGVIPEVKQIAEGRWEISFRQP